MQQSSSAFLWRTDFIPDRSCLGVPVGRKCSACNGLVPQFLYNPQYISERFPSHHLPTVAGHQDIHELGHVGDVCWTNIQVLFVFDGVHMEYWRRCYLRSKQSYFTIVVTKQI